MGSQRIRQTSEPVFWARLPMSFPAWALSARVVSPPSECVELEQDYQGADGRLSDGCVGSRYTIIVLSHMLEIFHNKKIFSLTSVVTL